MQSLMRSSMCSVFLPLWKMATTDCLDHKEVSCNTYTFVLLLFHFVRQEKRREFVLLRGGEGCKWRPSSSMQNKSQSDLKRLEKLGNLSLFTYGNIQ